jgi:chromosome segregation protein
VYLKRLDLHGFKTFADRTQVLFSSGVTCVIGPNGSGKSNIADAVLWVLGESNVRSLRGSQSQDVIFAGNERRRPLGMAEVSLTIDNTNRILPLDFAEVTVTRRLYRSGESEFLINRVSCRLKDIYELFLDTGVGRDAYSMINQGQIDQILSVRAEDRRAIFEEAAGIKKYRVRKKEAERKLEHTSQNLLRVHDILAELEAQIGPLQRQAAAARRYRDLAVCLRDLEHAWYGRGVRRLEGERKGLRGLVDELRGEQKRLEEGLNAAQAEEKSASETLAAVDADIQVLRNAETQGLQRIAESEAERVRAEERSGEVRRRLRVLEQELAEIERRIAERFEQARAAEREEAELKRDLDGVRGELWSCQEQARSARENHAAAARDLEARRQAWLARERQQAQRTAQLQSCEARLRAFRRQQSDLAGSRNEAAAEIQRLETEIAQSQADAREATERLSALTALHTEHAQTVKAVEQARNAARAAQEAASRAVSGHEARLQALAAVAERSEGAAEGARKLLAAVRSGAVAGEWRLLVEALRVPGGEERSVEAALGPYSDALWCGRTEDSVEALAWLQSRKATAVVLPEQPPAAPPLEGSLAENLGGAGAAADWARYLLARALPAADLAAAEALRVERPEVELWVTPRGEWLHNSGARSSGPAGVEGSAAAMLARRTELEKLRSQLPDLQQRAAAAGEAVCAAEDAVIAAQSALQETRQEQDRLRVERDGRGREQVRREQDLQRARQRLLRLGQDLAALAREIEAVATNEAALRETSCEGSGSNAGPAADREADLEAARVTVDRLDAERQATERRVADLRVQLAQQEQRLQSAAAATRRAAEAGASLDRQRADRLREQRTLAAEAEQRQLSFGALSGEAEQARAQVEEARVARAALEAARGGRAAAVESARARAREENSRLREMLERTHRAEVELAAVENQHRHFAQQWLDAAASAHSLEAEQGDGEREIAEGEEPEGVEPLDFSLEGLLDAWDAEAADQVLRAHSDPEGEIARLRRQIRALGAVNPDAVEQFAQVQERHTFLTAQRADLDDARRQLEEAIREIDEASRETFLAAFREIAAAFDTMFKKLFGGGTTELRLTDPDDVLETGVDIIVQPPGKKQQNLLLLSGGERALTAAAMLFALLTVRPSPFCVLDEVDAPLDETNVHRFAGTLREFAAQTQFIVVTHNRGTMEGADTLYGVTMQERGVSKVLSCSLDDPVVARVEAEQNPRPESERKAVGAG